MVTTSTSANWGQRCHHRWAIKLNQHCNSRHRKCFPCHTSPVPPAVLLGHIFGTLDSLIPLHEGKMSPTGNSPMMKIRNDQSQIVNLHYGRCLCLNIYDILKNSYHEVHTHSDYKKLQSAKASLSSQYIRVTAQSSRLPSECSLWLLSGFVSAYLSPTMLQ